MKMGVPMVKFSAQKLFLIDLFLCILFVLCGEECVDLEVNVQAMQELGPYNLKGISFACLD